MRYGIAGAMLAACGRLGFEPRGAGAVADAAYDAGIPGLSPVAWYPLDDPFGANSVARDASGNGRHASCVFCPRSELGRGGLQVASFDGVADALEIPYDPAFDFANGYTIAVWFDPGSVPTSGNVEGLVQRPYQNVFDNSYGIDIKNGGAAGALIEFSTAPNLHLQSLGRATANTWMHAAITFDGATKRIYLDGAFDIETSSGPMQYDAQATLIGADLDMGVRMNHLSGRMSDLRFYDRALSDAEIAALAR